MSDRATILNAEIARIDGQPPSSKLEKHIKMASSPFVFFRGSAQLFYADLAEGYISLPESLAKVPVTTIMGDCHTSNFGFLTEEGSHGDKIIFCPNDFDDACIGHAGWDLLRFITSLYLCFSHCQAIGEDESLDKEHQLVSKKTIEKAVNAFFPAI